MLEKLKQVLYEEYKTNGLTSETLALSQFIDKFINNIQKEEFDQYKKKFNTLY